MRPLLTLLLVLFAATAGAQPIVDSSALLSAGLLLKNRAEWRATDEANPTPFAHPQQGVSCPLGCIPVESVQALFSPDPKQKAAKSLMFSFGILSAIDLGRTLYEIGQARVLEQNPVLAWASDYPEGFAAIKASITGAVLLFFDWVRWRNPVGAIIGLAIANGIQLAVDLHNFRTSVQMDARSRQ